MKAYSVKATSHTPAINFDFNTGIFEIKGISIPEDVAVFYKPLLEILNTYIASPKPLTTLTIHLEYFNTRSSFAIVEILRTLEKINTAASKVVINWNYEDEDMKESGEDYQKVIKLPINLCSVVK